jgi:hypothetical protein
MLSTSSRTFIVALGAMAIVFGFAQGTTPAVGQSGDGWTSLLDDKTMGDWNHVGEANWRMEDRRRR